MKNTFKLMGIALIAGSMFVACSKDDDNDAITVNYTGDSEWTSNEMYALEAGSNMTASIYENEEDDSRVVTLQCGTTVGRHSFDGSQNFAAYDNGDHHDIVSTQNGHITISDIDMEANSMTAEIESEMGSIGSNKTLTVSIDDATWSNPSVTK